MAFFCTPETIAFQWWTPVALAFGLAVAFLAFALGFALDSVHFTSLFLLAFPGFSLRLVGLLFFCLFLLVALALALVLLVL